MKANHTCPFNAFGFDQMIQQFGLRCFAGKDAHGSPALGDQTTKLGSDCVGSGKARLLMGFVNVNGSLQDGWTKSDRVYRM